MSHLTRRSFLEHTLLVAAAGLASAEAHGENKAAEQPSPPAGDRIGIAVIGLHGRGLTHVDAYTYDDHVDVIALCDPDENTFAKAQGVLAGRGRSPAKTYTDIRKLLEDKEIDAVSIATPNHWHALASIWAMQAGKDVYVEKPVSHNVTEGRRIEQVRAKHGRICQAGTQSRSNPAHQHAVQYVRAGHIGKVLLARGLCYKPRKSIGHFEDSPVPSGVDYDLWLGPAPKRPFNKNRFHYEWHWNWDYGNGDIGNQGIHQMDMARWALGTELPSSVISFGGRFGYADDGQTPNTQVALLDYGTVPILFEVRGLPTPPMLGVNVGAIIYGTEGFVALGNEDSDSAVVFDNEGKKIKSFKGIGNHFFNFVSAVRSRKQSELNAPIVEGHLSTALCHLSNISYRLGKPQPFARRGRAVGEQIDLVEAFGRFEQHLADNTLALREMAYQLGPRLTFDPHSETFEGSEAASALLTRDYRDPFVVPKQA